MTCTGEACNTIKEARPVGQKLNAPLDAVPSPDGKVLYFTATIAAPSEEVEGDGADGVVASVPATGGSPTILERGFVAPVNITISTDGKTLFVADAGENPAKGRKQARGAIYSVPASGGAKAKLAGTDGTGPRGLELVKESGSDVLYFSGVSGGKAGVFKIAPAGGQPTTVASGDPITDPSGLVITRGGDVYVADTTNSEEALARVLKIAKGESSASVWFEDVRVGYPAGMALTKDEVFLLISGLQKTSAAVYRIKLADKSLVISTAGIGTNTEAGGLHRAHDVNRFAWSSPGVAGKTRTSDGKTGNAGTVYLITTEGAP